MTSCWLENASRARIRYHVWAAAAAAAASEAFGNCWWWS